MKSPKPFWMAVWDDGSIASIISSCNTKRDCVVRIGPFKNLRPVRFVPVISKLRKK